MSSNLKQQYDRIKSQRAYPNLHQWLSHWKRQPDEQWQQTRIRIWKRDRGLCQSPDGSPPKIYGFCQTAIDVDKAHIDHIRPITSGGSNHANNLRTLCPICHALREDLKHKAMRDKLVKSGTIPVAHSHLIWEF